MLSAEADLLADWVEGYKRNMPCSPRLHVITDAGDTQLRARDAFNGVWNVTFQVSAFPPPLVNAPTYHKVWT